jgi:subtilisin
MPAAISKEDRFEVTEFPLIDAEWAWAGADGSGVRVCVVDSGIDGSHPLVGPVDLAWEIRTDDQGEPRAEAGETRDLAGHGTACAGIIRSIAPRASLSSVRVLTDGRFGSGAALIAGLEHAIDHGFDVINLSLSTARPQFRVRLAELADRAYFRRCVLVVSAHNLPVESYPWNFSSVISVASHDEDDPTTFYYNPAPPVDFYARGARVLVAAPGGGRLRVTGNSFAAPHITGLSALILSRHPWLTPFQLKTVLYHCAANVRAGNVTAGKARGVA